MQVINSQSDPKAARRSPPIASVNRILASVVRSEAGSSLLEFSLALSILLTCMLGIIEISMAYYVDQFVSNAAKSATRYAIVRGASWSGTSCATYASYSCDASSANVTSFVDSSVPPGISSTLVTVTTTWPGTDPSGDTCDTTNGANSPTCIVKVTVSYPFNFLLPFVPVNLFTLSGVSSEVITE